MKHLTTNEIRQMWLDYFAQQDHHLEPAKSLIPVNDNSLLFINSGVATLKKYFDGSELPPKNRIANSQKSIRTNDIENVGLTSRHHTLFEMLGNFSIGDYFKSEAIEMAYEILTSSKWFDIDLDKLYFTVHPEDHAAFDKWAELGIDPSRIVALEENFWEIGKGPGGPNTEIFYDRGEKYDTRNVIDLLKEDLENDRIIEIWNIVFSEFNCDPENKAIKDYEELPQKNIDTGMGLERMACIMQEVDTNFETDNFMRIIDKLVATTNIAYEDKKMAYRVIADHIRALTFAIADGVLPANDGRGYVIRRILRRAVRFGYKDLNLTKPFLSPLVDEVIAVMQDFYPYLVENESFVKEVIVSEEEKFFATIEDGLKLLNKEIEQLDGKVVDGEVAFKLYDTYGFPIELTLEVCEELDLDVDIDGFNKALEMQRERARAAASDSMGMATQNAFLKTIEVPSHFIGYNDLTSESTVNFITDLHSSWDTLSEEFCYVILDKTPFYAESGGQVADMGLIASNQVLDVQKLPNGQHLHKLKVVQPFNLNDKVEVLVNPEFRNAVMQNHSSTHLLHFALHEVLGEHAKQAGSLQDNQKTRFDFSNLKALSNDEVVKINNLVNELINQSHDVVIKEMSVDEAKALGAEALFGEKYGDVVRVIQMGPSIELCGGTHVFNTKEIELFQIMSESGIGSGIRRIEATTGIGAQNYIESLYNSFHDMYRELDNKLQNKQVVNLTELELLVNKIKLVYDFKQSIITKFEQLKQLNEEVKQANKQASASQAGAIAGEVASLAVERDGFKYLDHTISGIDSKQAKGLVDEILNQMGSGAVCLRVETEDKFTIVVKVSDDATGTFNANAILQDIIKPHEGRGGGKPNMAQGGYQK